MERIRIVMLSFSRYGGLWRRIKAMAMVMAVACAVMFLGHGTALANGATRLVLEDVEAGPYLLQVGIIPGSPKVGSLHLSVQVYDAASDAPVTDAQVLISAIGPEGSTNVPSTSAQSPLTEQHFYEADIWLDAEGSWVVFMRIDASQGSATQEVPLEVTSGGISLALVAAVAVLTLAVSIWTWDRIKGRRRRQRQRR